ncbi:MAG: glutamate--tRNA ligase [Candidatus Micrarchaeota archaeon]|nr:glutamate--tRNA ligase [Candidatus Micrarchaeota archaeon]MDE1859336.1 glutamate--tRNA ligase [Candidatus Micrarchaeota archaeon]
MPLDNETRLIIRKYAIKNAIDYGKANEGSVLNKAISLNPDLKSDIKSLAQEVGKEVTKVNSMQKSELEQEYRNYAEEFDKQAQAKAKVAKPKFVLEGVKNGEFIGRASPEPSGYAHMGHAKQALLNYEFARRYSGKMYLYFDDTNPEKSKQEYVEAIKRDLEWLGVKFDKEYYASDNVELIYGYARQMIKSAKAYVCMCDRDKMKKERLEGIGCEHRNTNPEKNLQLFDDMVKGKFKEGEAVVRFVGDMTSQNTTMRDPVLLRIVDAPHYRMGNKYHVWPVYDFNTPILDSVNGITDIIRSKEYELRDELLKTILGALNLRVPRMHLEARLNIKGNVVQKRVIRKLLEDGFVTSWDDPRLMTLMALRRRGIQPEALREFVLRFGMSKTDSTVSIDILLAENKKVIDPIAKHLFFVPDPIQVSVKGAKETNVKLKLYPTKDDEFREYTVSDSFYISKDDADQAKSGEIIRLKDLMDITITSKGKSISADLGTGTSKDKIIQWVSEGNYEKCSIVIPGQIVDDDDQFNPDSLKTIEGYAESYVTNLKEHDIVQFERFGYCILDNKKSNQFIFISK